MCICYIELLPHELPYTPGLSKGGVVFNRGGVPLTVQPQHLFGSLGPESGPPWEELRGPEFFFFFFGGGVEGEVTAR